MSTLTPIERSALRMAALELGYRLTDYTEPTRGLVWYATPDGGVPLCIGDTREVERFIANHRKWLERPEWGAKRIQRWQAQKLRAAQRRTWRPSQHGYAASQAQ